MFVPNGAEVKALRSTGGAEFFVIALPQLADIAASRDGFRLNRKAKRLSGSRRNYRTMSRLFSAQQ